METITNELLARIDESVQLMQGERVKTGQPEISGVVRRGGSGEFVTVCVRLPHGQEAPLSDPALHQLASITNVPLPLLRELPDELVRATLTAQIRRRWSSFTQAVVSERQILAWMAPRWPGAGVQPSEVIGACLEGMQAQEPALMEPPRTGFRQKYLLTFPGLMHVFERSPSRNDKHCFGVSVEVDYTGWRVPELYAYGYRVVCRNGMIARANLPASRRSVWARSREEFLSKFRHYAAEVTGFIRMTLIPQIERSIQSRPTDPEARLRQVLAQLPPHIRGLVERAYAAEPLGGSDYHMINALTRAAQFSECPEDWRPRLRQLAGDLATGSRCPACFRVARSSANSRAARNASSPA